MCSRTLQHPGTDEKHSTDEALSENKLQMKYPVNYLQFLSWVSKKIFELLWSQCCFILGQQNQNQIKARHTEASRRLCCHIRKRGWKSIEKTLQDSNLCKLHNCSTLFTVFLQHIFRVSNLSLSPPELVCFPDLKPCARCSEKWCAYVRKKVYFETFVDVHLRSRLQHWLFWNLPTQLWARDPRDGDVQEKVAGIVEAGTFALISLLRLV